MNDRLKYKIWDKTENKWSDNLFLLPNGDVVIEMNTGERFVRKPETYVVCSSTGLKDSTKKLFLNQI